LKQIGIIIVVYNGRHYLEPLLRSLARTMEEGTWELCVLDNASTDGTADGLERLARELSLPLQLIRGEKNHGFMLGNNLAYEALRKTTPCDTVVLLNVDTVVHDGWWQALVAELAKPGVGTAAALLLLPDGTVNARGNTLHFLGLGYVRDYGCPVDAASESAAPIFFGSGAAVAFRPAVLEKVNGRLGTESIFWEEFFIYAEDSDLGWRMRLVGLDNRLVDASRVTHDHRFWLKGLDAVGDRLFLLERNRYLMMLVNFKAATLVLLLPWIIAAELALALRIMKLYPRRLHLWREIIKEARKTSTRVRRRGIQAGRTVGDREILRAMTGSIRHGAIPFRGLDRWIDAGLRWSHRFLIFLIRW
jgi:GT2 family glycosyltransferase